MLSALHAQSVRNQLRVPPAGQLPPDVLFEEAIDVLEAKCDKLLENLQ